MRKVTKQVLKDYEKVQSTDCLKLWVDNSGCCEDEELLKLPLNCAISDIDYVLDCMLAEVNSWYGNARKDMQRRIRSARAFLKKYNK